MERVSITAYEKTRNINTKLLGHSIVFSGWNIMETKHTVPFAHWRKWCFLCSYMLLNLKNYWVSFHYYELQPCYLQNEVMQPDQLTARSKHKFNERPD